MRTSLSIKRKKRLGNFSSNPKVVYLQPVTSYANFNGMMEDVIVDTGEDTTEGGLVKHALVAVEGSFKDSDGNGHDFSRDRLTTIAEHTNKAIEKGVSIPVCTDHQKTVDNTVGGLGDSGRAYTKVIEEGDLPNPKAKDMLGKVGLFLDDVVIKADNAIQKVKNNIVKSVSMGLNLDPQDHRIVELSLVPIPAIPNMGLFAFGGSETLENTAFTWEELETSEQTLDSLRQEFDELVEKLWTLLDNIYNSESADIGDLQSLKQFVYTALNGFNIRVLDILGLNEVPDQMNPAADAQAMSADQISQQQQMQQQDVASAAGGGFSRSNSTGLLNFSAIKEYTRF